MVVLGLGPRRSAWILLALLAGGGCTLVTNRGEFTVRDAGEDAAEASVDASLDGGPGSCFDRRDCPEIIDTEFECVGGECRILSCPEGFASCDGEDLNGCEADTSNDPANCGGCGVVCGGACVEGGCDQVVLMDLETQHACAMRESGQIQCWGRNRVGGVGDGSMSPVRRPATVVDGPGSSTPFLASAFAVTVEATCAIERASSGRLFCWGRGGFGENGSPERVVRLHPGPVTSEDASFEALRFVAIDASLSATCAIAEDGGVWCWGYADKGLVGERDAGVIFPTAARLALPAAATELAVGAAHACAVVEGGDLYCWGQNAFGQLGVGMSDTDAHPVPRRVDLNNVTLVTAGLRHTCAVVSGGSLYCWGNNGMFALGLADPENYPAPTRVVSVTGVRAVTAGRHHTCAQTREGPRCWGRNLGELGDGTVGPNHSAPATPLGVGSDAALFAGGLATCAVEEGVVRCWGDDEYGALAADDTVARPTASVPVGGETPIRGVTQLAADGQNGCALVRGVLWCWGLGRRGQNGVGDRLTLSTPATVATLPAVSQVSTGFHGSCAVSGADVFCWGTNVSGRLGDGTEVSESNVPVRVDLDGGGGEVTVGVNHACARQGLRVYCWGANHRGQLGRGEESAQEPANPPVAVGATPLRAEQISAGEAFTCARLSDRTAACWGAGGEGQLGSGMDDSSVPVRVGMLADVRDIDAGGAHACAVVGSAGQVFCWGTNSSGQLGPDGVAGPLPRLVRLPADAVRVAAGTDYSCAALTSGEVWCWGGNTNYQLGDGTHTASAEPVRVTGITDATDVVAGSHLSYHTCAQLEGPTDAEDDNTAVCWGGCWTGACGTASGPARPSPGPVLGL